MSPKRGDPVPPPTVGDEWEMRFGTSEAVDGWRDLCKQAPGNTRRAWDQMRTNPSPHGFDPRQHRLKGELATVRFDRRDLPQWQIEVTGAARIWYVVDDEKRHVWVTWASTKHPKRTE